MGEIGRGFSFLGIVILVLGLIFNLFPGLPRFPGDIYLGRGGLQIYIPWLSAILVSIFLSILFNFFNN